jgi:uncharacterized delta-60 repeat protein
MAAGSATLLRDIFPGTSSSMFNEQHGATGGPATSASLGDVLLFSANNGSLNGAAGAELWRTDGTPEGTALLADINTGTSANGNLSSSPGGFVVMNGVAYFAATDATTGRELWRSDGTAEGTFRVRDINSTSGTSPASYNGSNPANLAVVGDTLYFTAADGTHPVGLWKSDGTEEGTTLVTTAPVRVSRLTAVGDTLFFSASDAANGIELWKSDGTAEGTVVVKDVVAGTNSSLPASLTDFNGKLAFVATTSSAQPQLFLSDGTPEGTAVVKTLNTFATAGAPITNLTVAGPTLYFVATTVEYGHEVWRTDGTADGTTLVADLGPGNAGSAPNNLRVLPNGEIVFSAFVNDDAGNYVGSELYRSDGTAAGTGLLADINVGGAGSNPVPLAVTGDGRLYFRASNPANGTELYVTDGTTAGTFRAANIGPGDKSSSPFAVGVLGDALIFGATDGLTGFEPYHIASPTPPPPNQRPTGVIVAPASVDEGASLAVSGVDSADADGRVAVYQWDFDYDGVTFNVDATGVAPSRLADDGAATRRVALRVLDNEGAASDVVEAAVDIRNVAPTLNATAPAPAVEGLTYTLNLAVTDPGRDTVVSWSVDWGDGTVDTFTGATPAATHLYADNGSYVALVGATDEDGTYAVGSRNVTVANVAPTLGVTGAGSVDEGSAYALNLSASDAGRDTISSWSIDWGDGVVETIAGDASSASHVYADGPAQRAIAVTATDEDGTYAATAASVLGQSPSALDPTFANGFGYVTPAGTRVAVQADGKVITAVGRNIYRYTPTGAIDASFGNGGVVVLPTTPSNQYNDVAVQPDGKIVAAGHVSVTANGASEFDYVAVRLNPDGSRDASFGVDGVVTVDVQPGAQPTYELDRAERVEVLPDGKLLLAGQSFVNGNWRFTLARLNATGTIDSTFGTDGRVITSLGTRDSMLYDLSVGPDGKIVAGGYVGNAQNTGDRRFGVARYNANGTPDVTFGTNGAFVLPQAGFLGDEVRGVLSLSDGRVMVTGSRNGNGVIIRLSAAGTPDPTFATNGTRTDVGIPWYVSLAQDRSGRILVGSSGSAIARLLDNGQIDPAFGRVSVGSGGGNWTTDVVVTPSGRILTAATGRITRLLGDPTFAVQVRNVAPVANVRTWTSSVDEGSTGVTIRLGGLSDASPVDVAAGFRFSYDFDGDGTYDVVNGTSPEVTVPASYYADGPRTLNMVARVADKDGAHTTYVLPMSVNNVAPTGTLSQTGGATEAGAAATVMVTGVDDVSAADRAAGFTYDFDLDNDGSFEVIGSKLPTASRVFTDSGTYTVAARVVDRDGGRRALTAQVRVDNVAPTAVIADAPATAVEGSVIGLTSVVSDPSLADRDAGFTYAWSVKKDGFAYAMGSAGNFAFRPDDQGTYVVSFTATDADGATSAVDSKTIAVTNRAPTARFAASGAAVEGSPAAFTFTDADDAAADLGTLRYSFDFNNDGDFVDAGDVSNATSASAAFAFRDNGTYTVRGRVTDKDGGASTYAFSVNVASAAPAVTITPSTTTPKRNKAVSFTFRATDASPADQAGPFKYHVDWDGNGSIDQVLSGSSQVTASRTYKAAGTYVVCAYAVDKDGVVGLVSRITIRVR